MEADHLGRDGLGDDVGGGAASITTRCWAACSICMRLPWCFLIATAVVGNKVFGSTRWIRRRRLHAPDVGIRQDRADSAGGEVI